MTVPLHPAPTALVIQNTTAGIDSALSSMSLFDKSSLSDVKIKQIYGDQTRDYHAHKAVLCGQSSFFHNAFTGHFKEASESVIELHDDNPAHFEAMLKFMYTLEYQDLAMSVLSDKYDKLAAAKNIIGIYLVADKYDVRRLIEHTAKDFARACDATDDSSNLCDMIKAYYHEVPHAGRPLGKAMVDMFLTAHRKSSMVHVTKLSHTEPYFAADILARSTAKTCFHCHRIVVGFDADTGRNLYCNYCGGKF